MQFARLFDFETGQLLLHISSGEGGRGFLLNIATYHWEQCVQSGHPINSFSEASEAMTTVSYDRARLLQRALLLAVDDPSVTIIGRGKKEALTGFENWLNTPQ